MKSLCVYCGSSEGLNPIYKQEATRLGELMGENNIRLVFGGGTNGLMGAVARGVLAKGGKVLGVIPEFLLQHEKSFVEGIERVIVPDMHSRKKIMFDESDAFVAFPGGIGTLEELAEVMTWAQLKRHVKPVFIANISEFWTPLLKTFDHMREEGFIRQGFEVKPTIVNDAKTLINHLL